MIRPMRRRTRLKAIALPRARGVWPGLGVLDYNDLLAQANLQDCDPRDSACVSNNTAKQAAVEDFWAAHQSTGVPDDTKLTFAPQTQQQVSEFYSGNPLVGGNVVDTRGIMKVSGGASSSGGSGGSATGGSASGGSSNPVSGGQLSFTTSRGGTSLQVGDSWTITITGATPNQPVAVTGGKNGSTATTPMGTTDSNGRFALSGQFDASTVGSWYENWTVGGVSSGSFSFTVNATVRTTPDGKVIINSSGATQPAGSSGSAPASSGFDFSSIPVWGWAAAAGVALFALGGRH